MFRTSQEKGTQGAVFLTDEFYMTQKTGKCSKSKENPMQFNLPTEALPLESGCCCDR